MTDQDATQRYETPPIDQLPAEEAPATTAPVTLTAEPAGRGGGGRLRWIAAGIVTLAVVGTAAAATMMLTSDSGDPDVLAWAPADSMMYAELRLDLPGDQQAKLAQVISAFPGFDDQAAFDTKLAEALDQLVGKATAGKHDYRTEIDPWFGGQLSVTMGPLPSDPTPADMRVLLLASTTDAGKASAWADALLTESGASTATETYGGVTITTIKPSSEVPEEMQGLTSAYAVVGPVVAVGDLASVKAAIDTKGTDGLADDAQFRAAEASVTGDRLGFMYLDYAAFNEATKAMSEVGGAAPVELPAFFEDLQAPWVALSLRADGDGFRVETRSPHVDKLGPARTSESKIASLVPPTTVFLASGHDVGAGLQRLRDLAADDQDLKDGVKQLEDSLAVIGGSDAIIGWMGDIGLAVTRDGDKVAGGLLVTPTDAKEARELLIKLKGFLAFGGEGSGVTVSDEEYGGTTITSITIEDVGSLAGLFMGGAPVGSGLPQELVIAFAATDEVVTVGYTTDFVKAVLDARDGESLADTPRFKAMLDRADKSHASLSWVDVTAIREAIEGIIPADQRARYDAAYKPYLEPFDAIISTSVPGDDIDRGTMILGITGD